VWLPPAGTLPLVGLAYNRCAESLIKKSPDSVDYLEIPFELLRHDASLIGLRRFKPLILHCASMSIGGSVRPASTTVQEVFDWVGQTETPWLGEHLSFIAAEKPGDSSHWDQYAPGEPYNIGYTVSPPMNHETIRMVAEAVGACQHDFGVPLLLENPPLYFSPPGTTLSQADFIRAVCECTSADLLLDLTHFYITSRTFAFDPERELLKFPLERVVEVHVSGVDCQAGIHWDNHANPVPDQILQLLPIVLERGKVKAVTMEYNWPSAMVESVLLDEVDRVRRVVQRETLA
jgi:uncharacterized protein (UPF0276 family)